MQLHRVWQLSAMNITREVPRMTRAVVKRTITACGLSTVVLLSGCAEDSDPSQAADASTAGFVNALGNADQPDGFTDPSTQLHSAEGFGVDYSDSLQDPVLTLTWDANPQEVLGYYVYFGSSPENATQFLSDLSVTYADFNAASPQVRYSALKDLGVQSGDSVCFRVKAYDTVSESAVSDVACTTV